MKKIIQHLARIPQKLQRIDSTPLASDAGIFPLLVLSLVAAVAGALSQALLSMDHGIRGILTHGLVMLNGG